MAEVRALNPCTPRDLVLYQNNILFDSLDILRCKINNGEKAYMELARSKEEMTVEIIKENIVLIKYKILFDDLNGHLF